VNAVSAALAGAPATTAYLILAAALLAESVLLVGAFVPTLTMMLSAGALARTGQLHLLLVVAVAAGAVIVGDFLSQRAGRLLGARLRTAGIGRRVPATAWRRAEKLMARRGGQAVLVARFVPMMRTLVPYLAGATGLRYRRIAPYSVLAAGLWACAEAGAGYAAATVLQQVLTFAVPIAGGVLAVATAAALCARARTRMPTLDTEGSRADERLLFLK
jgi:membrane protein DedA with SNARE-associated domain